MRTFRRNIMATAIAAGLGLAAAMPAGAGPLSIRLTDSNSGTSYICADGDACDSNGAANALTINSTLANAALGSSVFDINNIGASSNFLVGDPLAAIITASGNVVSKATTAGAKPLIVEVSQIGWLKPVSQPRTLSQGPTATFTNSGVGDFLVAWGLNDAQNLLWAGNPAFDPPNTNASGLPAGALDDFVTSAVQFDASAGDPDCGAPSGNIQTCSGQSNLAGIDEGNPFSLGMRIVVTTGPSTVSGAVNRVDFTDAVSKFSSPVEVPEPGTIPLMGLGLLGMVALARRKQT